MGTRNGTAAGADPATPAGDEGGNETKLYQATGPAGDAPHPAGDEGAKPEKVKLYQVTSMTPWIPSAISTAAGAAVAVAVTAALVILWRRAPESDATEGLHQTESGSGVE